MGRYGGFRLLEKRAVSDARDEGTDQVALWENEDGVTVRVQVMEYPHREFVPGQGSILVAEYWVVVEGSDHMDGAGPEAPFEGVHGTVRAAKYEARDVMRRIAHDDPRVEAAD